MFKGDIANISANFDEDKEGNFYEDYFSNAMNYYMTNYEDFGGMRLDLSKDLPKAFKNKFDTVFCHTVLEHIFDIKKSFSNLCQMAREYVIIIVPFDHPIHENTKYGDYWRFTPSCVIKLFKENGFILFYYSMNKTLFASKYIFAIGKRYIK
jgi:hypothetical protein